MRLLPGRSGHVRQLVRSCLSSSLRADCKSDPKTGSGGYDDIKLVGGKPEFMARDGKAANKGGTYWLRAEDKVAFDDAKFAAGDEVASILVSKFAGDRGEIDAAKSTLRWRGRTARTRS